MGKKKYNNPGLFEYIDDRVMIDYSPNGKVPYVLTKEEHARFNNLDLPEDEIQKAKEAYSKLQGEMSSFDVLLRELGEFWKDKL